MSATSALLRGRVAAEALMLDTCTIRRVASSTSDPDTGVKTPTYTTVYSGKCKVQQRSTAANPTDVGEAELLASQLELHIPVSATGVRADDVATIDTSVLDPDLAGQVFTIRGEAHKSYATARRLTVEELNS
ncbi:MAG TPA: DUF6093 family protein [Nocardioidaceae bacterium]|nr:DUF6093 family protein [Nocardioidaceae bacterium]